MCLYYKQFHLLRQSLTMKESNLNKGLCLMPGEMPCEAKGTSAFSLSHRTRRWESHSETTHRGTERQKDKATTKLRHSLLTWH